jgi:Sec-independent protein translocase protein TatA
MFNKDSGLPEFLKDLDGFLKDFTKTMGNASPENIEKAFKNEIKENLKKMGIVVETKSNRVSYSDSEAGHKIKVLLGKNYVEGSATVEVLKESRTLNVKASFKVEKANDTIEESAVFKISLKEGISIDKPVASFKDGNLEVLFPIEKETVEVKIS